MKRKKRVSNRSLQLYLALRMSGLSIAEPSFFYVRSYYGLDLGNNIDIFIHKRRAVFSIEDNKSHSEKFLVSRTKINDKSMDLILEYVTW